MVSKKQEVFFLVLLLLALFLVNYNFLDNTLKNFVSDSRTVSIARVIDGDTVVTTGSEHVRLLGINAPEISSHEPFSQEAKDFLTSLVLSKNVTLEFTRERTDKYGRTLAYIYINRSNVNVQMVENGFANYYFYSGRDKYSDALENAWETCLQKNMNLCEKSEDVCASCVSLSETYIINSCSFSCDVQDWVVKGEGRDKVSLNGTLVPGQKENFDLDLENSGGSLFLRDSKFNLVNFKIF